ncbi:MAG: ribosome biogenesis GTPase Der [Candidatus Krumholzibacteria bacterium]|nr:ribosome biogenesis GTPase Der [Candidatus Krumholzibacteria bacterium]
MKGMPIVAIVGKPNAGKSTLFNRIVKRRRAIMHSTRGVTRDAVEERVEWNGVAFLLMDMGGFATGVKDQISADIRERVKEVARKAAVVILVVDVDTGVTDEDESLVRAMRRERDKIVLVVNKVESDPDRWGMHEFHSLGFSEAYPVSAVHGSGIGEILDEVVSRLPKRSAPEGEEPLAIAIVGKPNVGKSSLVNALAGEKRNIVSEIPGTTRDSVSILVRRAGKEFILVDTAGVKRRSRTQKGLGAITSLKSLSSARNADIIAVMIDATEPISRQDVRVASEGHKARKGMMVLVNKWDLVEKDTQTADRYVESVRESMSFLSYAPVITISALTGLRVEKILPVAMSIQKERKRKITTSELNRIIERAVDASPPSYHGGGIGKVYYATQTGTEPPTFTLFVNKAAYFPRSYIRYINNQIRKVFTFDGTAITISLKSKER